MIGRLLVHQTHTLRPTHHLLSEKNLDFRPAPKKKIVGDMRKSINLGGLLRALATYRPNMDGKLTHTHIV